MSQLTRAEKNKIIIDEAKGILNPEYYCLTTKNGTLQVRKRKTPLATQPTVEQPVIDHKESSEPKGSVERSESENYDTVSNKQLLEKMLSILEKNSESKDLNLSSPENEKITEENKTYIENIKQDMKEEPKEDMKEEPKEVAKQEELKPVAQKRKPRGRTIVDYETSQPIIHETINRGRGRRIL